MHKQELQKQLREKLQELENNLQTAQMWDSTAPEAEKLNSREPFCVDTLAFEQWLQWIFIPRLHTMLSNNFNGLPNKSDIHTMAVYQFKNYSQNTTDICSTISDIDKLLNNY